MIESVLVLAGGACGAMCRFALSSLIKRIFVTGFPVATMTINCIGSFLLGLLVGSCGSDCFYLFAGVGFMGGFTTFSIFQTENAALFHEKRYRDLALYSGGSLVLCVFLAWMGMILGSM